MKVAEIRQYIEHRMKTRGMSAYRLARACEGVAPETIERWFTPEQAPPIKLETLQSILDALQLELHIRTRRNPTA